MLLFLTICAGADGHDEIVCSKCGFTLGANGDYYIKSDIVDAWNKEMLK